MINSKLNNGCEAVNKTISSPIALTVGRDRWPSISTLSLHIYFFLCPLYKHQHKYMHVEKEMATHSSVLAWRIPGTGEPGRLPSMGLHRVRHNWSDLAAAEHIHIHYIYIYTHTHMCICRWYIYIHVHIYRINIYHVYKIMLHAKSTQFA